MKRQSQCSINRNMQMFLVSKKCTYIKCVDQYFENLKLGKKH